MKKPQWIVIAAAFSLVTVIYVFGRTTSSKKTATTVQSDDDGHDHGGGDITIDTIMKVVKKQLTAEQAVRVNTLENSISRGDVKEQQLDVYHQLAHFWGDSAQVFEPYAWYTAEASRLENSEKTLTFAAHLFLDNLQQTEDPRLVKWKALQAKDLFERSLKINPENDSSKVGLGASYLFGGIGSPMEGVAKIREVAERDSTHVYAQLTLAKGSLISGEYDKAIGRLQTVSRVEPGNLEAILMLAELYERTGRKANAAEWYQKSLNYINRADARTEIKKRIEALRK